MEKHEIEDPDFTGHTAKCRLCFCSFVDDQDYMAISRDMAKKFKEVTQTELIICDEYSKKICVTCNDHITNHWLYRQQLVVLQSKLYKFLLHQDFTEYIEEDYVDGDFPVKSDAGGKLFIVDEEESDALFVSCNDDMKETFSSCNESELLEEVAEESAVESHKANIEKRRLSGKLGDNVCPHCDVRIMVRSQLKRHIERVHLRVKNYSCDKCDYACYFKYSLGNHMKKHDNRESRPIFACDKCDHETVNIGSFRQHKLTHLKIEPQLHECRTCSEQFDSYNKLYRHKLKAHASTEALICDFCNKTLKTNFALKNHVNLFHVESKPSLSCTVEGCPKVCVTSKQLRNHMKTHDEGAKEICPECGIQIANKHSLGKHIKRVHLKLRNFVCDRCDYRGFFKFNIVEHMRKHLDISERDKFYCDLCQFHSVSKTSMRTHKRSEHSGQKKTWQCHCGKVFSQNSSYYTHVKIVHEKIKRHECRLCPKAFYDKSQLKNHFKLQHLNQKDLPCEVCQKMFATRKHLQSHMKYHAAPQYICQFENCSNAFYTPAQLNSHIKVHKNIRDFKCHLCEKSYFHRSHLKKHFLTHGVS